MCMSNINIYKKKIHVTLLKKNKNYTLYFGYPKTDPN